MLALPEAIRLLSPDVILRETSTRGFPSVICLESREVAALRFLAADPDAQQHVLSVVDHFTTSYECQGLADAGRGFKKLVLVPARGRGLAPDQAAAGAMGGGRAQDDATGNANHRAVPTSPSIRITYNCVAMERYGMSLDSALRRLVTEGKHGDLRLVQRVGRSILEGTAFLHKHGIAHRDIKPANLLVDNLTSCRVKLCDMGSCKFMGALGEGSERAPDVHASTPRVTTRFYRAPELFLGTQQYSVAVDVWSVAMVLTEIYLGVPLLCGLDSEESQVLLIWALLGPPSPADLDAMRTPMDVRRALPFGAPGMGVGASLAVLEAAQLRDARAARDNSLRSQFVHLLQRLLVYNPATRLTARQAIGHPFFRR